jgi:hypothetical protein
VLVVLPANPATKSPVKATLDFFAAGSSCTFATTKSRIAIGFGGDATVSSRDGGKTRKLAFGYVAGESWSQRPPVPNFVDCRNWNSQRGAVETRVLATG